MKLTDKQIVFAALVGNKTINAVPKIAAIENELAKRVLPPFSIFPLRNEASKVDGFSSSLNDNLWKADEPVGESQQFFPLTILLDGVEFTLPYEPMISISSKNEIIKRSVARSRSVQNKEDYQSGGTIKEWWARGDYEISITGALVGSIMTGDVSECFPRADFEKLRNRLTRAQSLQVRCEPLQLLGINQIVVESFDFPFTKGENVQAYDIQAVSDFDRPLLIENTNTIETDVV